jgi:hypothetical protein
MRLSKAVVLSFCLLMGLMTFWSLNTTPIASAAGPTCFWDSTDAPTKAVPCGSGTGAASLKSASISPQPDHCYNIQETLVNGFPGLPTVSSAAAGSDQCNSWQGTAETVAASPAQCIKVAAKPDDYVKNNVTPGMFSSTSCTNSLLSKQPAGSTLSKFQNGACYLIFNNNVITSADSCAEIMQEAASAQTAKDNQQNGSGSVGLNGPAPAGDTCGAGDNAVRISLKIGCQGKGNPVVDMMFAIIRFLSLGVGIVVVGSIVAAGIQYTSSRGDPQAVKMAQGRITNTVIALIIYIFTYAVLNWILPAGLLK